jgi:hypothetical protein
MTDRVWRVSHLSANGDRIDEVTPYSTLKEAVAQARHWLGQGTKDVWIIDSDGNRIGKSEIDAFGSN